MNISEVFKCLDSIAKLEIHCKKSKLYIEECIRNSTDVITSFQEGSEQVEIYSKFLADVYACFKSHSIDEQSIICGANVIYLLHCVYVTYESLSQKTNCPTTYDEELKKLNRSIQQKDTPKDYAQIISIQHLKVIEKATKYVLYTSICHCLDSESSLFMKMKISKENLVFANNLDEIDKSCQHKFLKLNLKYLLPIFKDPCLGESLRANLLGEFISPILQLSFSPLSMAEFPEDVPPFRTELEYFFQSCDQVNVLQIVILIRTLVQNVQRSWLKRCCHSLFIRRFLFKENGVALVLQSALSICDLDDWQKKEAVATLVSSVKFANEMEFYEKVGPQIVSLILLQENSGNIIHILGFLVLQLINRSKLLASTYIIKPILRPLLAITEITSISNDNSRALEEYGIMRCISVLYKLYVEAMPPHSDLGFFIEPVLCAIFKVSTLPLTCHVKTNATHIIVRYLTQLETSKCVIALSTLSDLELSSDFSPVKTGTVLLCSMDEIHADVYPESNEDKSIEPDEMETKSILCILEKLKNPVVVKEFYQKLLLYLDFTIFNTVKVPDNFLLTDDDKIEMQIIKARKLTKAVHLLTNISEHQSLNDDLFHDFSSAVPFFKDLLKIGEQSCDDEGFSVIKSSLLLNCVMLISSYAKDRTALKKMTYSDWESLTHLLPTLESLHHFNSNPALLEFTDQLKATIYKHGHSVASNVQASKLSSFAKKVNESGLKAKSNIAQDKGTFNSYDEALEDICSPHLPVRGHALLSFAKLLDQRDVTAVNNKNKLLALFEHHLKDEDSYIYLMAVQGLVSLSDIFPDKIVLVLTSEVNSGNLTIETKVKMIEVLTQVTKRLGPLLPKYKNIFINSLLTGVRDEDELIRTSSLSNLGEVCKQLRFSIGPIVQEIFAIIYFIIKCDKSIMVRCAAVQIVTLLFQGLGKDSLKVLQSVILDIYKELKFLLRTENDLTILTHCELAMEEISSATKEFLLPNLKLEKKILITELPPSF